MSREKRPARTPQATAGRAAALLNSTGSTGTARASSPQRMGGIGLGQWGIPVLVWRRWYNYWDITEPRSQFHKNKSSSAIIFRSAIIFFFTWVGECHSQFLGRKNNRSWRFIFGEAGLRWSGEDREQVRNVYQYGPEVRPAWTGPHRPEQTRQTRPDHIGCERQALVTGSRVYRNGYVCAALLAVGDRYLNSVDWRTKIGGENRVIVKPPITGSFQQ